MVGPRHIEEKLYKKILRAIPIPCVDAVVVRRGKFLLGKRANRPAKGEWWFVGGRVLKGETLLRAVARHVRIETGIANIKIKRILTARETIFRNSEQGPSSHTVNIVYLAEAPSLRVFRANKESSAFGWFSEIDKKWRPYVKDALRLAGFK